MKKISTGKNIFLKISVIFFLLYSLSLYSEETELQPYKLINADKLILTKVNEGYITNLIGNVHFFYGETEFFSDEADIFEEEKIARLWGNVEVYDDTLSLYADKVDYFRITEKLVLDENVLINEAHKDSTIRTFKAEHVDYFRKERELYALENVRMYDEREDLNGSCGQLNYYLKDGYGYLMKSPVLSLAGEDSIQISAEKMEYFKDFEKVVATFNVITQSTEFELTSDFLLYFAQEDKAIYLGDPKFSSESADASAIELQLLFEDKRMKKAILKDSCSVFFKTEEESSDNSWVTSNSMYFDFEDGKVKLFDAQDNVDSYYHQDETDNKEMAINKATGKHLIISINNENEIETIDMRKQVQGLYKFHKK